MITNAINANINFVYFCLNFKHDFIEKCWADEPTQINHLNSKFINLYKTKGTALMPFFFSELDRDNQLKLSKWINENYLSFEDLGDNKKSPFEIWKMANEKNLSPEERKQLWINEGVIIKKPQHFIGVDSFDGVNSYCLARKLHDDTVEILMSKQISSDYIFEKEVENLAKYFNAEILKEKR